MTNNNVIPLEAFLYKRNGEPPVAFYSKPHPIEAAYVGRAWKNLK
jgi:hypothetical protein